MLQNLPSCTVPLFQSGTVFICRTFDEWQNAHLEMGVDTPLVRQTGAANSFLHTAGGKDVHLLGVFDGNPATIAHESAHIVFDICQSVGINPCEQETFCYLLDWLVGFAIKMTRF